MKSWHRFLPFLLVSLVYASSRVFYRQLGIEFDDGPLTWFWQYIDLDLLRDQTWSSLYYQHTQPPLYNVYLAIGVRLD